MIAKHSRALGLAIVALAGGLTLALLAGATPGPVPLRESPVSQAFQARLRRTIQRQTRWASSSCRPNEGPPGTEDDLQRDRARTEQGRDDRLEHVGRPVDARPARRQRGLHRPQGAEFGVVYGTTTTDERLFRLATKLPRDFGGLHDIYAVIDGVKVAKGGALVTRTSSRSGRRRARSAHDPHQRHWPRLESLRVGRGHLLRQQVRRRRDRELDARRRSRHDRAAGRSERAQSSRARRCSPTT